MKKLSNIFASFFSCLAVLGILGSFVIVSAQTQDEKNLADYIKMRTNRTFAGLVERRNADGGITVDLEDRFQNLMLARLGYDGEPVAACVTDLAEANLFFGKDLETGDFLTGFQTFTDQNLNDEAARHGMSPEELLFYKNLINEYAAQIAASPNSATITIVNNDTAGEGFNDPTAVSTEGGNAGTTLGAQRLNVFQAAAAIWGNFLDSSVNIQVRSQFDPQTCTSTSAVLGSAGTRTVHMDFSSSAQAGTWYHQALANKYVGYDLTPTEDINATFNSNLNGSAGCLGGRRFYLGFDNATPSQTVNLLVVLLHEMGHGLGFSSFANGQTGALFNASPDVYTSKMYDNTTAKFWNNMTDAERAVSAINANNVMWDGSNTKIASGVLTGGRDAANGRVQLYTPGTFSGGSSVSHWNTAASPNLLMEPSINNNLSLNLDLTPHLLRDIGWFRDTNTDTVPDAILSVLPTAGTIVVNTQANVFWVNAGGFNKNVDIELSLDGGNTFPVTLASNIANTGSFTFTVPNQPTTQARIRVREHNYAAPSGTSNANFTIAALSFVPTRTAFDFDGDRKTDVSIFRPASGEWWYLRSSDGGVPAVQFGQSTDKIVPADFTGDGKTDIAFWRESTGQWFIIRSEDSSFYAFPFGQTGDKAVPADFDGDGKADPTVFRPSNSVWYSLLSSNGEVSIRQFGASGDIPLPSDFDGDGKADPAIFRPGTSEWWIQKSFNNTVSAVQFGAAGDKPVPADFTGDQRTDIAFFRPSNGFWYVLRSEDASFYAFPFGSNGDTPAVGDYDGDGRADAAVFRSSNSTWYLQQTTSGFTAVQFGANGDKPVPSAYTP
ncbi:hypothetical protein BH20ACI4_BH20ACI4_11100 [soil metagenome]